LEDLLFDQGTYYRRLPDQRPYVFIIYFCRLFNLF